MPRLILQRPRRWLRPASWAIVAASVLSVFGTAPALAGESSWLDSVACPSLSQCTAIDEGGQETTFNPASPGSSPRTTIDSVSVGNPIEHLNGLACPSSTECVAVDYGKRAISFNPLSPATATATTLDSAIGTLYSVACPSPTQCTAVGIASGRPANGGLVVTFDPTVPGSAVATIVTDQFVGGHPFIGGPYVSVACPSLSQCTAVDRANRLAVTFNPTAPANPTIGRIDSKAYLWSVACPSTAQCTATDALGHAVTFNPLSPATHSIVKVDRAPCGPATHHSCTLLNVACPSLSQCTAVDLGGREVTFDPLASRRAKLRVVDRGYLFAVACPSVAQCTAGGASHRPTTFNPTH